MKTLIVLIIATLLVIIFSGCASEQGLHVEPTAQIVKVPVMVACVDSIPQPEVAFLTDAQLLDGTDYQVVNNLRIDRDLRREYEATLLSTLQACVK